jgi:TolB-like protein
MLADTGPHRDAVLLALERLLAWPEMVRSPQLAKFLTYIVNRTLDGEGQGIKAYSIAVDVFGRPADFDPQSDPIVRVQARRLRALINSYYESQGEAEPVQIRLPTGRYIPEFVVTQPAPDIAPAAPAPSRMTRWWMIAAPLVVVLVVAAFGLMRWLQADPVGPTMGRPSITILEFAKRAQTGTPRVSGLAIELVTDLEQFENLEVHYGGGEQADPQTDFVLSGAVYTDGDVVSYRASLTDNAMGSTVWDHTIPTTQAEAAQPAILDRLSRSLSLLIGSPRGPLHARARARALASSEPPRLPSIYACRVLFELYREMNVDAERVRQCLSRLPAASQSQAGVLAMRASIAVDTIPPSSAENVRAQVFEEASGYLSRALQIRPVSSFVWEQRARLQELRGEHVMALSDYGSAIQLNPANTSAMAALARLLLFIGWNAEVRPMAMEALSGAPEPPAWYYGAPAALALLDRNFNDAMQMAERYASADREIGLVLTIVATQGAGNEALVNRYLPPLLDLPSFREVGIFPRLRLRITNEALLDVIRDGLLAAGVPPASLDKPF